MNIMKEKEKQQVIYPFEECELYVDLLQRNIDRMANNSANCKNWLIAIIAGALTVTFAKSDPELYPKIITLLKWVTGIFFFLDCLYLGIERDMIKAEKAFIKACKANNPNDDDIKKYWMSFSKTIDIINKTPNECCIKFKQIWKQLKGAFCALFSLSTTPFYSVILYVLFQFD